MRSPLATAALLLLAGSSLLAGCAGEADYRPAAAGPEGQVTVVVDSSRWNGPVGEALRAELAPPIQTLPTPEPFFDLRQVNLTPDRLERIQRFKNIVFAAALSDSTYEAQFLRGQFSEEARQALQDGGTAIDRGDLWRRNQQVYYLAAATPQALVQTIRERGPAIRDSLNLATRRRTYAQMFEKGRQPDLEDTLMAHHGFAVDVQHDYEIGPDTTISDSSGARGFVLLGRLLPDTWRRLFVYYEENADPSTLSSEWVYQTRDSLAQEYYQGTLCGYARLDRRGIAKRSYLQTEGVTFLDRYAYETRGLWYYAEETEDGGYQMCGDGGPLLNYTFYDRTQDRLYMIDGMVYAPTYDKREFLRQLEVIAHTFRTRPEVQPQQGEEVARAEQ